MQRYDAIIHFRDDLDEEYRLSRGEPIGKDMMSSLGKVLEISHELEAGEYELDLGNDRLQCRIIELTPPMDGDSGSIILEPNFSIVPRSLEEICQVIDQLKALGWR